MGEDIGANRGEAGPRGPGPSGHPGALAAQRQPDRQAERDPDPRVDDEQHVAVEPAKAERFEQADAVIVEPVARRMAETTQIDESEQPALVNRQEIRSEENTNETQYIRRISYT